ncbi:MAG: hypothetical protein HYV78_01725 [Candidatus Wildermuthbacteria bacterium]|nr:hypothetical protein [Candidatus Wildermuthbacteria bacterium]
MVIVQFRDGHVVVSPNQVRRHDIEMNAEIERLQRNVALELFNLKLEEVSKEERELVRDEMWNRFYHSLREARRQDANNPASPRKYGLLNGDQRMEGMMWRRIFPREDVLTVILCTNGIITWPVIESMDDHAIGVTILDEFRLRGVAGLLNAARGIEEKKVATAYTNNAEATVVAIEEF